MCGSWLWWLNRSTQCWGFIHQTTVPQSTGRLGILWTLWVGVSECSVLSWSPVPPPHYIAADLALVSIVDSGFMESLPSGPLLTLLPPCGDRGYESPQDPLMRAPTTGTMPSRPYIVNADVYRIDLSKDSALSLLLTSM